MLEVEVFDATTRAPGLEGWVGGEARRLASAACVAPTFVEIRRLCVLATASAGVQHGHLAIEFVDVERITRLNAEHRKEPTPTDVLSFPVDGVDPVAGVSSPGGTASVAGGGSRVGPPAEEGRELGDVVICPERAVDLREAILHGVLHLVGMDHETDNGEMLALQRELLAWERR
jgi:probable rRNA maturation factor